MKKKYLYVFLSVFLMKSVNASDTMDYDDVRAVGGFDSERLRGVCRIIPAGDPLYDHEKYALILSPHLKCVHTLDLSAQNINDDFIKKLSEYSNLEKIINLDLSKNILVTMDSIDYILRSEILGKKRDLPQISGRYGIPSTTIYINARDTSVIPHESGSNYFEKHRFNFNITYTNPQMNPNKNGVKFVEVILD